jgi:hypothetical protein
VYGLDSLDEVSLHREIAAVWSNHFTVTREAHFPSASDRRKTHRGRCDLVLTPAGRPLMIASADAEAPLFAPANACPPEDAVWIEVKRAAQFQTPDVRNSAYGSTWRDGVMKDLSKIEADPRIRDAGLLLMLFTGAEAAIEPDLRRFEEQLAIAGLLAGFVCRRTLAIADRIGHRFLTIAVWPTVARAA